MARLLELTQVLPITLFQKIRGVTRSFLAGDTELQKSVYFCFQI